MKKHKKIKTQTPVIETKNNFIPGSVGEFIELLKEFPADEKFALNGSVDIGDVNEKHLVIYPKPSKSNSEEVNEAVLNAINNLTMADDDECAECNNGCDCVDDGTAKIFMDDQARGICYNNQEVLNYIRETSSDTLTSNSLTTPNTHQIKFESDNLRPNQYFMLDEIRQHNMAMAESLGELHRREIAALLEYNTQCLAHFGATTNITMCEIVDAYKDNNK